MKANEITISDEMDKPLVSVIIPIFNSGKFMEKCIDSVLNQTYINLGIILVNDGSTDESGKICEKYQLNDKRIRVIAKKNGGPSDARNAGMEIMNGAYVLFIDSDDYVDRHLDVYSEILEMRDNEQKEK